MANCKSLPGVTALVNAGGYSMVMTPKGGGNWCPTTVAKKKYIYIYMCVNIYIYIIIYIYYIIYIYIIYIIYIYICPPSVYRSPQQLWMVQHGLTPNFAVFWLRSPSIPFDLPWFRGVQLSSLRLARVPLAGASLSRLAALQVGHPRWWIRLGGPEKWGFPSMVWRQNRWFIVYNGESAETENGWFWGYLYLIANPHMALYFGNPFISPRCFLDVEDDWRFQGKIHENGAL